MSSVSGVWTSPCIVGCLLFKVGSAPDCHPFIHQPIWFSYTICAQLMTRLCVHMLLVRLRFPPNVCSQEISKLQRKFCFSTQYLTTPVLDNMDSWVSRLQMPSTVTSIPNLFTRNHTQTGAICFQPNYGQYVTYSVSSANHAIVSVCFEIALLVRKWAYTVFGVSFHAEHGFSFTIQSE